ncbi:MAG: hypothetical protein ACXWEY_08345 [Bacteroidia bacterium]
MGVSYLNVKFNNSIDYGFHGIHSFSSDDHGQFLNMNLQLKGYALNPRYCLQPYLSAGIIARNYWLQQNHILYDRETKDEVARINNRFQGITLHCSINPTLQLRVLPSIEVFTELNLRFSYW